MIRKFTLALCIHIIAIAVMMAVPFTARPSFASNDCQTILTNALKLVQNNCDALERNNACYGNNQIEAQFQPNSSPTFQSPGDKVPVQVIKNLSTSPLDVQAGTWGLSMLKLQANLPDTMPGQNVTFMIYGNTSIQNTDGKMNAFYFSSGLGSPECKAVPQDGIMVRSPKHMNITFTVDGVKITIASTIVLHATPKKALTVQLIEGHATVSTSAGWQTLQPGQITSVPLGGVNGLQAVGQPSLPTIPPADPGIIAIYQTVDQVNQSQTPLPLNGCISAISDHSITIDGYTVQIDTSDPKFSNLSVGQCVQLTGTVTDGKITVSANDQGTATPDATAQVTSDNAAQSSDDNSSNTSVATLETNQDQTTQNDSTDKGKKNTPVPSAANKNNGNGQNQNGNGNKSAPAPKKGK